MSRNYYRGSKWRKWDLHVHTASSDDYKYKSEDADAKLVAAWRNLGIRAVAITDHFKIDATRIINLRKLAPEMVLFPGVEFRTDKGATNIHVIGIFSEKEDVVDLENKFTHQMLPKAKAVANFDTIYWDYKDICAFVHNRGGLISAHASRKSNGVDTISKTHMEVALAIKTDYAETVDIYEVGNMEGYREYKSKVLPAIGTRPLIICSDNHNPNEYTTNTSLWLKGDLTFETLKEAVNQPEERIYLGDTPPKIAHENENAQRIISKIKIKKKDEARNLENWFDTEIKLNSSVVAIIGNKGSGKSALSDIIGLATKSKNSNHSSFLKQERFNKVGKNYGDDYYVEIEWNDGNKSDQISLSEDIHNYQESISKAQYLPQKYIEDVCSNLDDTFQEEINSVLFSYIPETTKGNAVNFNELISNKAHAVNEEITALQYDIEEMVGKLVSLEELKTQSYFEKLSENLQEHKTQLEREESLKPIEVNKPPKENRNTKMIESIKISIDGLEKEIEENKKILSNSNNSLDIITRLLAEVDVQIMKVTELNEKIDNTLKNFIDKENYKIKIESPKNKFEELILSYESNVTDLRQKIDGELTPKLDSLINQRELLIEQSSAEERKYEKYLESVKSWELRKSDIVGDKYKENTILFLEDKIEYIKKQLDCDISEIETKLQSKISQIYTKKQSIVNIYDDIYEPIDKQMQILLKDIDDNIRFSTKLEIDNGIGEKVLENINKQYTSLFSGKNDSYKQMEKLTTSMNGSEITTVLEYISTVKRCGLEQDFDKINLVLRDKASVYKSLMGLDYIKVKYSLTLNDRLIEELSPGERGLLLLIFYLALSKDKNPIIIDQPEDNLDNQSVYKKLVPCIREAKKKRQVILVTHNPNIAVACDAEQIIVASIDKKNSTISYSSGSIENEGLNDKIVEILEGTQPAFELRKKKYNF